APASEDEEATEFLSVRPSGLGPSARVLADQANPFAPVAATGAISATGPAVSPQTASGALRAPGRAVPLEDPAADVVAPAPEARTTAFVGAPSTGATDPRRAVPQRGGRPGRPEREATEPLLHIDG